jgi:hypothetical protein
MFDTQELLQLVAENPELPIVPMVETEVIGGDEFGYWLAKIGKCAVKEFAIDEWYGDGIVRFRDEHNAETDLIEAIAEGKYDGTDEDYEKAKLEAGALWTKAIILYVNTRD